MAHDDSASVQSPVPELARRASAPDAHATANQAMFERIAPTYDVLSRLMTAGIDRRWRNAATTRSLTQMSGFSGSFTSETSTPAYVSRARGQAGEYTASALRVSPSARVTRLPIRLP